MKDKARNIALVFIGGLIGIFAMWMFNYFQNSSQTKTSTHVESRHYDQKEASETANKGLSIDQKTAEKTIIAFVKNHGHLPDYYIKKNEARKLGWEASKGNLCDVLPGKAIGGDHFGNREKLLPKGVQYYEADVNYNCGHRNADRIIFTTKGEVWLTKNHYKSFEKK